MADIPAPLANRHTAVVVVALCLFGAASAIASLLVPDDTLVVWLVVVRQVAFALQAAVLALAAFLVARTLVRRSLGTLLIGLLALGGLLLLALTQLAAILLVTPWAFDSLRTVVTVLLVASTAATALGLLLLGVAVVRHDVWRGPTRLTLVVAAFVTLGWAFFLPLVYALWSLVLLGLASGLTSRRAVANAGVPQGAAAA
jgi:hypothetical protein